MTSLTIIKKTEKGWLASTEDNQFCILNFDEELPQSIQEVHVSLPEHIHELWESPRFQDESSFLLVPVVDAELQMSFESNGSFCA